jgi:hypothetical protein
MSINFSSSTPAAPTGGENVTYQTDGTNFSFYGKKAVKLASPSATGTVSILAVETVEVATAGASDITRTLPPASGLTERIVTVKKIDSGAGSVIVEGNGSETIDGALNYTLVNQWQYVRLLCDGLGWNVIGNN